MGKKMASKDVAEDLAVIKTTVDQHKEMLREMGRVIINQAETTTQLVAMEKSQAEFHRNIEKSQDRLENTQNKQWIEIDKNKAFVKMWAGAGVALGVIATIISIYVAMNKLAG